MFKNKKVLVVDDDEANQYYMKQILNENCCSFDLASNGHEAVEKVKTNKYNVVFMDINMPVMNGFEATRKIRETIDKDVLIVAVSSEMSENIDKYHMVGMNGFISKGGETEKFIENILSWIKMS